MNRLIDIGFIKVGYWKISDGALKYFLDGMYANVRNNLYAFVCDSEVMYVGKTNRKLRSRMYHYSNPGPKQSTNIKNNKYILNMLDKGIAVDIFSLPDSGLMHYGQFHLNLAAGLEDSIIKIINPKWNGNRNQTVINDDIISIHKPDDITAFYELSQKNKSNIFNFNMTNTYWSRGFFNVPVISKNEFGTDGDKIKIIFRDNKYFAVGIINRTANSSGSPRIMGGIDLRKYFQLTYNVDDVISFEVITPNVIKLR